MHKWPGFVEFFVQMILMTLSAPFRMG